MLTNEVLQSHVKVGYDDTKYLNVILDKVPSDLHVCTITEKASTEFTFKPRHSVDLGK